MLDFDDLFDKIPKNQNFSAIISKKQIYIDKTDIIYKIARHDEFQFLSRPRRFGKSTIVSLLKELYTHGVNDFIDKNGVKQESYFKDLAIKKLWTDNKSYKVIHLNFASLPNDTELIEQRLKSIGKSVEDSLYLAIETFRIGFIEAIKQHFEQYNFTITKNVLSPNMLLKDFVKQAGIGETVLLIDEYDYPLTHPQENLTKDEFDFFTNEVLAIMRNFYATIKNDIAEYFRKIFITGITRYKDASIFTDGNTITDISLDPSFGTITGFTRNEIKKYFYDHLRYATIQHFKIQEDEINDEHIEKLLDKLASWYDGYCFDELNMYHVYSTISILSFLSNRYSLFKQYWYDLGGLPAVLRSNLDKILNINNLNLLTHEDYHIYDVKRDEFISPSSYKTMNPYVLLYQCGYLTLADELRYGIDLKVPNFEIKHSLALLQETKLFNKSFNKIRANLSYECQSFDIQDLFNSIINHSDYLKFRYDNEALVVQAIAIFLLAKGYLVLLEDTNAKGRRDLRIDLDNDKTLVFEFKFNKKDSNISDDELLANALAQIKDKNYNQIINKQVRAFACVFNEEQRQISAFEELAIIRE